MADQKISAFGAVTALTIDDADIYALARSSNNTNKKITALQNALYAVSKSGLVVIKSGIIDGLALGSTLVLANLAGKRLVPIPGLPPFVELAARTGALTGAASLSIGNNAGQDNLIAITPLTGLSTVNSLLALALIATPLSLDINATGLSVKVTTAATGSTVYSLRVNIPCLIY